MPKSWTICDADKNHYMPGTVSMRADASSPLSAEKRTLHCGASAGVDVIEVSNGDFAFSVVPTRGMSVHAARFGDETIGWQSPVRGPVHPSLVDLGEPGGLGWLDGFDELLVRCGLESNGAPEHDAKTGRLVYPLHGRIGNKPAHAVAVEITDDEVIVTGVVDEARFHFLKVRMTSTIRLRKGETGFRITDSVRNLSQSPAEIQMLYHVNFGAPLLDAGSRLVAPVRTLVPRNEHAAAGIASWDHYSAAEPGFEEQVYFLELLGDDSGRTTTMLRNAHGTRGAALHFNRKQLPVFTQWKNTTAVEDGFVTGLEPGTNFPNPRSYEGEQGRVQRLAVGEAVEFALTLEYLTNAAAVTAVETAIARTQGTVSPVIHKAPLEGWCAP